VVFWEYVAPTLRGGSSPFEGFLLGWTFFTMGAHMALLIQIAVTTSHRLAEDRINGALELILSTPLTVADPARTRPGLAAADRGNGVGCFVRAFHPALGRADDDRIGRQAQRYGV
jgi:hypothetical protein